MERDRLNGEWFVCDGPHGYQHRILEAGPAFDRTVCDVKLSDDASLLAIAPAMFKALCELIEKADTSDDFRYGTLATTFVREIAKNAIAGHCPTPPTKAACVGSGQDAAIASQPGDDFVLVPREPTKEMLDAAIAVKPVGQFYPGFTATESEYANEKYFGRDRRANVYRAMLAAAPAPSAGRES